MGSQCLHWTHCRAQPWHTLGQQPKGTVCAGSAERMAHAIERTLPKTTCLPSRCGAFLSVMKNCEPADDGKARQDADRRARGACGRVSKMLGKKKQLGGLAVSLATGGSATRDEPACVVAALSCQPWGLSGAQRGGGVARAARAICVRALVGHREQAGAVVQQLKCLRPCVQCAAQPGRMGKGDTRPKAVNATSGCGESSSRWIGREGSGRAAASCAAAAGQICWLPSAPREEHRPRQERSSGS